MHTLVMVTSVGFGVALVAAVIGWLLAPNVGGHDDADRDHHVDCGGYR